VDIIVCDGAIVPLHELGIVPKAIIGDLDSIPDSLRRLYSGILHRIGEQESNDLTKAVRYAAGQGYGSAVILGATGLREDHTIGNISLLLDYSRIINDIEMISDYGVFTPVRGSRVFSSRPGQQVSIFAPRCGAWISSEGLRWELRNKRPESWWECTLNEAVGEEFRLSVSGEDAGAVVFRLF
jgi:thiamine pyrophosphokinase